MRGNTTPQHPNLNFRRNTLGVSPTNNQNNVGRVRSNSTGGAVPSAPPGNRLTANRVLKPTQPGNNEYFLTPLTSTSRTPSNDANSTRQVASIQQRRRLTIQNPDATFKMDGASPSSTHNSVAAQKTSLTHMPLVRQMRGDSYITAAKTMVGAAPQYLNKVNQDSYKMIEKRLGPRNLLFRLFCVMDGHGIYGREVSQWLNSFLPVYLLNDIKDSIDFSESPSSTNGSLAVAPTGAGEPSSSNGVSLSQQENDSVKEAVLRAFCRSNQELVDHTKIDVMLSGSTVVCIIIIGDLLYAANVGDSRAIMVKQVRTEGAPVESVQWNIQSLTDDQKPDRSDENARILQHGGRVEALQGVDGEELGPARVWLKDRDVPGLAMSRSMGDSVAGTVGVISEPEILKVKLCERDCGFLLIASDGIWEFLSNEAAADIVKPFYATSNALGAADALVTEARRKWCEEEEVIDDITCIIIFYNIGH